MPLWFSGQVWEINQVTIVLNIKLVEHVLILNVNNWMLKQWAKYTNIKHFETYEMLMQIIEHVFQGNILALNTMTTILKGLWKIKVKIKLNLHTNLEFLSNFFYELNKMFCNLNCYSFGALLFRDVNDLRVTGSSVFKLLCALPFISKIDYYCD